MKQFPGRSLVAGIALLLFVLVEAMSWHLIVDEIPALFNARRLSPPDFRLSTISTVASFRKAIESGPVVMLIDAHWSLTAAVSRTHFIELALEWNGRPTNRPLSFICVDLTQPGELYDEVEKWLGRAQQIGGTTSGGNGPIYWLRNGAIVSEVYSGTRASPQELLARTAALAADGDFQSR